jgi:two-component system sensor histidine kinase RegB
MSPYLSLDAGTRNLRRLFILRWIVLAATAGVIALAQRVAEIELPVFALGVVLGCSAVLNAWTGWRLRSPPPVGDPELFLQLLGDVGVLTGVLYFSGGWSNSFVTLFLLPLVIAATLLPARYAWAMAAVTFGCYTLLGFFFVPLPHIHHGDSEFGLHVIGMWASFALSAGVIAYFVVRMAESLRTRDRELAAARESALRDSQVLAMGTLAAGAAHQLGTPLATMAIVVRELQRSHGADAALGEELHQLRLQIDHCKRIISDMAASVGEQRAEGGTSQPLDEYLAHAIESWQALRPGVTVHCAWQGPQPAPRIFNELTLGQSLVSLLDNAADASPEGIEMVGSWTPQSLSLEIRDRGAGVSPEIARTAGRSAISTKPDGHGVGLLIATAAIERFGGTVSLTNRAGGGACTRLELPLERIAA